MIVRPLDKADYGYALFSWRESAKKAPGPDRLPWSYFKTTHGSAFEKILDSGTALGAYTNEGELVGWLVMTPGKRVHTVHWVYVKHEKRRRGVMTALLDAADLGSRFIYTLRARRHRAPLPDGGTTKSLDETLVASLRARGVTATFVPLLKEWLK